MILNLVDVTCVYLDIILLYSIISDENTYSN